MRSIPLVRQATLAPAVQYLAAEGVPVDRYLRRANISAPCPETLETLIPLFQVCDFLSSVAGEEGIHDLGFHLVGQHGTEHLGLYGRFLAQSLTIHELIQTSIELIASYNSGLQIWVEHHGDQVRYCQKFVETLPRNRITEAVHFGLASAMATSRYAQGAAWQPNRIDLASDPIDLAIYFPGLGGIPVSFSQPFTSIWLDRRLLSTPLPTFDPALCPRAGEEARASLAKSSPAVNFAGQLEQAIESVIGRSDIHLRSIAAIVGTSTRTLQRRLAEQGSSFSRLLQRVRFQHSQQLLQDPKMRLTEIARRLGYTDLANFIRAFTRWTGVGPGEFRRLQYENEHE